MSDLTLAIPVTVNGVARTVYAAPGQLLAELLRDQLDLKACHVGCLTGDCGACTVLLDGKASKACLTLAVAMAGRTVVTLEGDDSAVMQELQAAFIAENAFQCGFCTAGMLAASADLLRRNPTPHDDEIRWAIGGNLCRCTGYEPIVRAIRTVAGQRGATHDRHHPHCGT